MIDKEKFMEHLLKEFPTVFNTHFVYDMLEKIIEYANNRTGSSKDGCVWFLLDILPEVTEGEIRQFYVEQ